MSSTSKLLFCMIYFMLFTSLHRLVCALPDEPRDCHTGHDPLANCLPDELPNYWTRDLTHDRRVPRKDPVVWGSEPFDFRAQYEENGYILFPNVFTEAELLPYEVELERVKDVLVEEIQSEIDQGGELAVTERSRVVTEKGAPTVVRSVFSVHKTNTILHTLATDPRIVNLAKKVLDDEVYIFQSRINFQPAFTGNGFYWHSDFETWYSEDGMPRPRALSVVIFFDDNNATNGALMVMPGSHKEYIGCAGRQSEKNWEESLKNNGRYGSPSQGSITDMARKYGVVHAGGKRGSILMFDCNLLHGSHSNISPFSRRNLFEVFNARSNQVGEPFHAAGRRPEHVAHRLDLEYL